MRVCGYTTCEGPARPRFTGRSVYIYIYICVVRVSNCLVHEWTYLGFLQVSGCSWLAIWRHRVSMSACVHAYKGHMEEHMHACLNGTCVLYSVDRSIIQGRLPASSIRICMPKSVGSSVGFCCLEANIGLKRKGSGLQGQHGLQRVPFFSTSINVRRLLWRSVSSIKIDKL